MLFITTGMGGGTGSGAAPVIAKAAKEKGILTVAVVTKPFDFEGKKRMEVAEECLNLLKENVDTLIVIPNQNLFKIANEKTTFADAFKMADDVLYQGVCGITNLITDPGMINLDFADIKTVMGNMGKAMMGTGESSGEDRAKKAAEEALNNPLLDDSDIRGAKSILLNIQGGPDMALFEVDEAASKIRNEVDENANIIFGSSIDSSLEGIIKVSIVATGINNNYKNEPTKIINTDENYNEFNNINEDHKSIEEFELEKDLQVIDDIDPELKNNKNDQIDLETQINRLKIDLDEQNENKLDVHVFKNNLTNPPKDGLKSILENKPKNELTEKKSTNFFRRFSSFFGVDNNQEIPTGPDMKIEDKIKTIDSNTDKDFEEKLSITELSKPSESFDLFNEKNEAKENDLVNLIDLEQENKEIDEKVLEIPAFLRRQAN